MNMNIQDKTRLKEIIKDFMNLCMDRYYITDYPQITKSDNITRGYNDKQSIQLDMMIKVFIETL